MGNAGRNGGQYYTPRPLIRAMIQVIDPQIGEKIYDGAAGSCGFLCEAYEYMYERMEKTTDHLKTLQEHTFYGKEKKNLAYVIGIMNMILHGIEAPNIIHTNTLGENIRDIQEKDRYHVILANPPFGGKERKEVQQNFDIKTGETASLFLQHFIKSLSQDLSLSQGKGFSISNLKRMRQFYLAYPNGATLSHHLSWSHYVELLKIDDPLERSFYEKQSTLENWSIRELQRQKKTSLYLRLAASKDKEGILQLAKEGQTIQRPEDLMREPYVLEFLKIPEPYHLSESELESRLISYLSINTNSTSPTAKSSDAWWSRSCINWKKMNKKAAIILESLKALI